MSEEPLRTALVRSVVFTCLWNTLRLTFFRKRRRNAGKCDNLSFLRVCLSRMDNVLGGTNGYAPNYFTPRGILCHQQRSPCVSDG